ncbi:hypothetical protein N7468_009718 [Penicillium chermesinum]|uniref:Xylanolytic transcriptional activator regulatory domain-containing protein n=1 Tax=Penicillium chermesinum TaxID=63820 RepID=A0A9W9NID1_9EURO|nr:uncharacterized protein N7468_009718 [Penicillium chermesinum]KAJ5220514.1 hypothetical protein N7468_009718 [Penicillium chermesinum]
MSRAGHSSRRSTVACNRCRARKTRCAGKPPLPCAACVDVGHAQARAPPVRNRPLSTPIASTSNSDPQEAEVSAERDDWWYKDTENLFLNRSGERHFVGASSATHLAKRLNPTSQNLAWDVRPLYDDPSSLRRPVGGPLPQLPPFEFAKKLFYTQYAYIGTIFSLIRPAQFEERLDIVYHHPPDFSHRESCLMYCQILLVIAFGLMYSVNQWSGDDGPPGFKYFKHALRFLPDIHEEGSIFFVEVLCYVAYYMQNLNRRDAAFLYIGLALRMAISLGLHQEVVDADLSEADRKRRRQAWWSVYSLDRLLSVKSGNPITIHDEDIGTKWPAELDGSTPEPWPSVVLGHYTKLSRILGRIGEEIYPQKTSLWVEPYKIPDRLRIDFTTLDNPISRETISVNLHFYSCLNMTTRPLVFYVIQRRLESGRLGASMDDWREGLATNTVAVIDSCITAARATTMIMDAARRQSLIATYGYLDGEYIFSAALLLVMVNAAFPPTVVNARAMENALGILRSMADQGNAYLSSRHSLLLELQASIGPRVLRSYSNGLSELAAEGSRSLDAQEVDTSVAITSDDWQQASNLPSLQDISFRFDPNDDSAIWEGALNQIDIDMDTDWIESNLYR